MGGQLQVAGVCGSGCNPSNSGSNDRCANERCYTGNGDYCTGDNLIGCPNTLYHCSNGIVTFVQVCPNGCVTVQNMDDYCQ